MVDICLRIQVKSNRQDITNDESVWTDRKIHPSVLRKYSGLTFHWLLNVPKSTKILNYNLMKLLT